MDPSLILALIIRTYNLAVWVVVGRRLMRLPARPALRVTRYSIILVTILSMVLLDYGAWATYFGVDPALSRIITTAFTTFSALVGTVLLSAQSEL